MDFKIIGAVTKRETIAVGNAIRELPRLRRITAGGADENERGSHG